MQRQEEIASKGKAMLNCVVIQCFEFKEQNKENTEGFNPVIKNHIHF